MRIGPTVVLTGMVAAVVVVADRLFGEAFGNGFTTEWIALWALSAGAALLLAKAAFRLAGWLARSEDGFVARWKRVEEVRRIMSIAQYDPRILEDFEAAKRRAESGL
jgi:hypothetical protein